MADHDPPVIGGVLGAVVAEVDVVVVDAEDLDLAGGVRHAEPRAARKAGAAARSFLEDPPALTSGISNGSFPAVGRHWKR